MFSRVVSVVISFLLPHLATIEIDLVFLSVGSTTRHGHHHHHQLLLLIHSSFIVCGNRNEMLNKKNKYLLWTDKLFLSSSLCSSFSTCGFEPEINQPTLYMHLLFEINRPSSSSPSIEHNNNNISMSSM